MTIKEGKEKSYKDWFDLNSDPYSRECFLYAERGADLMEREIASDEVTQSVIARCADNLSHVADKTGITGFMYGCAVGILSQCWKYGEELRKWHNKEYNYEGDEVVNPEILTISK